MQGSIGVHSEVGKGSRFWFTATLTRVPAESIASQPPVDVDLSAIRILVVDDNDTNREILTHQLAAWGIQHDCARSAEEAQRRMLIATRHSRPYDIVILDREMPDVDGMALAKRIKSDQELQGARLVMLSSVNQLTETSQWFAMGIDLYLSKPVRQVELLDAIITITRGEADKPVPRRARPKPAAAAQVSAKFSGHVLLAEDNAVNQELAQAMLKDLGCSVTLVTNGREAVEAVAATPFDSMQRAYDLVFMDCQMPEMDGYDATRKIRDWEARQGVAARLPIVALTANAMAGDHERCLAAGMTDYLNKPFSQERLAAILARWLPLAATLPAAPPAVAEPQALREPRRKAAAGTALDQKALDAIRALSKDGNPNLLGQIIALYLKDAPVLVERMRGAVQSGDAKELRTAAHTLKSSSANLGAVKLAGLCKDLERMGAENRMQDSAATLNVLEFEFDGACQALARAMQQQAAA
jgi:CheY-like chemotaxis protein/HPt (histidine-containing phosphotransfer) domain-containing protein